MRARIGGAAVLVNLVPPLSDPATDRQPSTQLSLVTKSPSPWWNADRHSDRRPFLQDGMTATLEYYGDEALSVQLPQKVKCKIVETEPVVKGQTAANSYKPAILDNGVRIMIPPFIGPDEDIIVHTELMEYSERA